MNTLYHQNKKILKAFTADEAEKGWRRIVKFEIGDLIDKTLQIYKNNEEANQAFGKFMARLQKILSGNAVEHFLDPSIQFSVDLTNQQQILYLADLITRRIIEMTKIDRRLIPNAVILHDVIAKFLPSFAGYFRSFIATHSYLLQLTLDRFVEVFSKSMKEAGGDPRDFINHCLDDKATVQLFCCIEKTKVTETCKKVHELYGQRLLWEFCLAFDRLPQLPISTMTTMLVFIKYCGDVFSNPSCRYFRQFATLMLPLLMAFADDDVSLAIKEMAEKMDANDLKLHLEKLHSCVQQNVKDHLRAVGSIRFPQ
uniref:Uncharacterized protein n=1 Tax=Panagrolaimus sp. JU765 TaxID=591449 RepID=A0AC34QPT8_9BILA